MAPITGQMRPLKPEHLPSVYQAQLCPVCGYQLDFKPWDRNCSSQEICPGCGIHFGYHDVCGGQGLAARMAVYIRWRVAWECNGRQWRTKRVVTIATAEELSATTAADRAVLFIDVLWSGTAIRSRHVVSALEQEWRSDSSRPAVSFYRVDLSDQEGPIWDGVRQWLVAESVPADRLIDGGNGALVWIREGSAVDWVGYAAGEGVAALVERTQRIYGA
jgi:hypothetical protein